MSKYQPSPVEQPVVDQPNAIPSVIQPTGAVQYPPVRAVLDPDNPQWADPPWLGAAKAFIMWLASVACLLLLPLVLVLPYVIHKVIISHQAAFGDLLNDKTFLLLNVLGVIPAHVVTFAIAYLVVTSSRRFPFRKTLGFSWPPSWKTFIFSSPNWPESFTTFKGVIICSLIGGALFGVGALITQLFPGQKTDLDVLIESSYGARVVTAFLAVATAPLVEEVVYRGMLYPGLNRIIGAGPSIALVSLLFAGVHFLQYKNNLAVIVVITLVSVTLTTVRALTHRLLPSFVIHLVFNGIQAFIFLVAPFLTRFQEPTPHPAPADLLTLVLKHLF
ncbi:MAG TPA: type II CAAX endopeptidase family protein [Pyrinomonadaceae bacterium]